MRDELIAKADNFAVTVVKLRRHTCESKAMLQSCSAIISGKWPCIGDDAVAQEGVVRPATIPFARAAAT
jgi:hypothetical protein